jgi:putative ABC transport system ATP-binding protein
MISKHSDIIQLEALSRAYHTDEIETLALSGVYLNIRKGEFVVISGPSGCGKSTLLSILGLLDRPTGGTYWLDGADTRTFDSRTAARIRNQQIGFVFQSFNLIGNLTVYENVELPLVYRGIAAKSRRDQVMASLDRLQMTHRRNHLPSQLSGGQQQRVAVARALVGNPTILFADEPTGNLDTRNGDRILELLQELNADGSTLCMVTHEKAHEERAHRVFRMLDGKVVQTEDRRELEADPLP